MVNSLVPNSYKILFYSCKIAVSCFTFMIETMKICLLFQVALLIQIGKEAIPPDIVPHILTSRDRKELAKYCLSAPPHGLCLVSINYNESHLMPPTGSPAKSFGRQHTIRKCKVPFY